MSGISDVGEVRQAVFRGKFVRSLKSFVSKAAFWKYQQPVSKFVRSLGEVSFAVFRQALKQNRYFLLKNSFRFDVRV